ncbi:MAG TPA: hypothetical protein VNJ11_01075 [Bryobacteraceae bacterium]|nr:hypothetical protein [Bryobacteraceae bacterium]
MPKDPAELVEIARQFMREWRAAQAAQAAQAALAPESQPDPAVTLELRRAAVERLNRQGVHVREGVAGHRLAVVVPPEADEPTVSEALRILGFDTLPRLPGPAAPGREWGVRWEAWRRWRADQEFARPGGAR